MSAATEKRNNTMKAQLLEVIRQNPGVQANDLSKVSFALRRFFRVLEKDGAIEYRDGWFATPKVTELGRYQKLAREGRVFVRTFNQREQPVTVKVKDITSVQQDGSLMCWTSLTPLCVQPDRLIVK